MQPRFPKEKNRWMAEVERKLLQFDVDIKRLWKRMPQGFRQTDGDFTGQPFPPQPIVPDPPGPSGSEETLPPGATGTDDTLGTIPDQPDCGACGESLWDWDAGLSEWQLVTNNCGAGCNPVSPVAPGTFDGQQQTTCCEESLSGTVVSGTNTANEQECGCGSTQWLWQANETWLKASDDCVAPCTSTPQPPQDGTFVGELREICCEQVTGSLDTGESLSGTPESGTPLSGSHSPQTSIPGSGTAVPASGTSSGDQGTGMSNGGSGTVEDPASGTSSGDQGTGADPASGTSTGDQGTGIDPASGTSSGELGTGQSNGFSGTDTASGTSSGDQGTGQSNGGSGTSVANTGGTNTAQGVVCECGAHEYIWNAGFFTWDLGDGGCTETCVSLQPDTDGDFDGEVREVCCTE